MIINCFHFPKSLFHVILYHKHQFSYQNLSKQILTMHKPKKKYKT